jgi:hypothetical protein
MSLKKNLKNEDLFGRFSYLLTSAVSFEPEHEGELLNAYTHIDNATVLENFTKKLNKIFFKKTKSKKQINVLIDEKIYNNIFEKMENLQKEYYNIFRSKKDNSYMLVVELNDLKMMNDVSFKTVDNKMFYV